MVYKIHTGNCLSGYFSGNSEKRRRRDFKEQPHTLFGPAVLRSLSFIL
jgi:hypothetical protein